MGLDEILEKLQHPETLVNPSEIINIVQYISQYITDFELEHDEKRMEYSFTWEKIKYEQGEDGKALTDKQTEIRMMREPVTKRLNELRRMLGELKRYRTDMNRKLDIIMNIRNGR